MTDGDLRLLIAAKLSAFEQEDLYALLDVEMSATGEQIDRAYLQLVKLLHPDKLRRRDLGELEGKVPRLFDGLIRAHGLLSKPDRREKYDAQRTGKSGVRAGQPGERHQMISRAAPARGEPVLPAGVTEKELLDRPVESFGPSERSEVARWTHNQGATLFTKADYEGAEKLFQRAIELNPSNPLYTLKLGWTIFRNPSRAPQERQMMAKPFLESAGARDAYNPDACYCMSQYFKEFGNEDQYKRELEAVLRCDENHPRARHELAEIYERLAHTAEGGTLGVARKPEPKAGLLRQSLNRILRRPS